MFFYGISFSDLTIYHHVVGILKFILKLNFTARNLLLYEKGGGTNY